MKHTHLRFRTVLSPFIETYGIRVCRGHIKALFLLLLQFCVAIVDAVAVVDTVVVAIVVVAVAAAAADMCLGIFICAARTYAGINLGY